MDPLNNFCIVDNCSNASIILEVSLYFQSSPWKERHRSVSSVHPRTFNSRINVIALLAYHLSLSDDLDDLYVAELEDEPQSKTKGELPQKTPL